MKPAIKNFHSDALGMFLYFMRAAWNPIGRQRVVDDTRRVVEKMRQYRCSHINFFMWLSDNDPEHVPLNGRTPYKKSGKKFDLDRWNNKYWGLFRTFLEICRDAGITPIPTPLMDRYCYYPYDHNKQGVSGFWSEGVKKYHNKLMTELCLSFWEVYGPMYNPCIDPINEAMHGGNHNKFHIIGHWFRDMWEDVLKHFTVLENYYIDGSHCEAGLGEFDKRKDCQFCGMPMGNNKYLKSGRRRVVPEYHGFSIKENLTPSKWEPFVGSAWLLGKFSEDCGGGPLAEGYEISGFRFGTAAQNKELVKQMWTDVGDRAIFGLFPGECNYIKGPRWIEDYSMKRFNDFNVWKRYHKVREGYVSVFG